LSPAEMIAAMEVEDIGIDPIEDANYSVSRFES
jgi:hypothetical protein